MKLLVGPTAVKSHEKNSKELFRSCLGIRRSPKMCQFIAKEVYSLRQKKNTQTSQETQGRTKQKMGVTVSASGLLQPALPLVLPHFPRDPQSTSPAALLNSLNDNCFSDSITSNHI